MVSISTDLFPQIPGYEIVEQLYMGVRTAVYRAIDLPLKRSVVIKVLRREYPSFGELVQFCNQYTITKNLPIAGIIHPLKLESVGNTYALVMDDWGGIALGEYIEYQSLSLIDVLIIGIQLADILHQLCQHRVVHKDIKPANILIHPDTKQIKLIDFSIASLLPKETQEIQTPNTLEGTLAYLAPEQTGRMNRGIDYRTDFYALGVTLYQLLSGTLPFISNDPLELLHNHIAKIPTFPHTLRSQESVVTLNSTSVQERGDTSNTQDPTPNPLKEIVLKLMAKNAEDRYQSALGLKYDLEQCLIQLKETGTIAKFELGQRDLSDRFLIPEKLYGRESEIKILLDAFERISGHLPEKDNEGQITTDKPQSEMMLVAGFSGIGKTAIINEVHKPIVRQRGYFIKGKFDQFNRNIPLSAFVQALRHLIGQLLCESDAQLAQWKAEILEALGENGQVLIAVIPELEQIIGLQPSVPELSGDAAQNRFNLLFQKFIAVFSTAEHPLVIFLDDLQWADLASLQLIKLLMNNSSYLLMLGAYRDNEVNPVHPFILMVEDLKKAGVTINKITLKPLTVEHMNHLVADTLHCSTKRAKPLTELITRKTKGNPFFTTQFLKALHQEGYINFDSDRRYWQCDITQVNALSLTDDVVEFMALQLQKLPTETQNTLKLAACIGNKFDLNTLAIVSEQSPTEAATVLWKALQDGLVLPMSQVYKFFQDIEQSQAEDTVNPQYRFLHDRVQQAAMSLIAEDQKQQTHWQIGQLLLKHSSESQRQENIFNIVNQLNFGKNQARSSTERQILAELNLTASERAKMSTAYSAALDYAKTGLSLLSSNCWQNQLKLTLALSEKAAETAFLCGNFVQMEDWIETILNQNINLLDKIPTYQTLILAKVAQNQTIAAIEIGLEILELLGIQFPQQPTFEQITQALQSTQTILAETSIDQLLNLEPMQAPEKIAALNILDTLSAPAYGCNKELYPLLIFQQIHLSFQYGNSPSSIGGYLAYGLLLCALAGEIDTGYAFGQLALRLLDKLNAKSYSAKAATIIGGYLNFYKESVRETLPLFKSGYSDGLETGELEFATYCAFLHPAYSYLSGQELDGVRKELMLSTQAIRNCYQEAVLHKTSVFYQAVLNLQTEVENPCDLIGEVYDESVMLSQHQQAQDFTTIYYLYFNKLILCYLLGEYEQAEKNASIAQQYSEYVVGLLMIPVFYFYESLNLLALWRIDQEKQDKNTILEKVTIHQTYLQQLAAHAPVNFQHKCDLINAEKYQILEQKTEAIEYYDLAIARAKENGYIQEEALANELAAKFYLNWHKEKVAAGYMQDAYYCYSRWGAIAKIHELESRYPQLLTPILQQQSTSLSATQTLFSTSTSSPFKTSLASASNSSSTSISATLDLATVLKTSQILSSEIELDKLLATLLQTVLENAGADKGVLLMPHEQEWYVEAVAIFEKPAKIESIALAESSEFPHQLIYQVKHSLQPVIIADAMVHPTGSTDDYILQQQPKSLLCTPILQQGKLVAILYLENQVSVGAFTRDRVELLNILCTQAAISLQNARLYRQERDKFQKLQEKNRLIAFQSHVSHIAARNDDLSDMLQQFCQTMVDQLGASFARIWILQPTENILELKASAGLYTHLNGGHQYVPVGKFKIGLIAEEKTPHLTNNVLNDPRVGNHEWAKREGMVAFAGYPLMLNSELLGVVAMFAQRPLSDATFSSLKVVATEISLGIHRKLLEASLQQKATILEQALTDLQQAQLQMVQGEKMASLGNLVAGVAHEINNPLGFLNGSIHNAEEYVQDLLGHLELYQQHHPNTATPVLENADEIDLEFLQEDLLQLLQSMKGATDRIKNISTSLRTFSRADTEHQVSANLHDGIDSTLLILKYRLKASEYRPEIKVIQDYGDLPEVNCFPGQFNQVLMNILANAIDMFDEMALQMSSEQLKEQPQIITIKTEFIPEPNTVKIGISDNGKGMTEATKNKIFDHLFTTKAVGKGTGLGLAIARQIIVEKHNGQLICDSTVGKGTEFMIQIPT